MTDITIIEAYKLLLDADDILIVSHAHPDEDTLGSALALKNMLDSLGKNSRIVCDDQVTSRNIRTLGVSNMLPESIADFDYKFVVFVDVATLELAGEFGQSLEGKIDLKIDHHKDGDRYAKYNLIDGKSAACAEIIFEIIKLSGKLNLTNEQYLYTAISADTGGFKYSCVTPKTHRIAAELLEGGVDGGEVNHLLFECTTRKEILASTITNQVMKFLYNDKIAVVTFSNKMKEENGLVDDDLGNIISFPRRIMGVELSIVIKQQTDTPEKYKISMRSGKEITANRMCLLFGGGGHECASGATVTASSPEEAENIVISAVMKELENNG